MHILIVSHVYNNGEPSQGISPIPHTFIGSLEESGVATFETIYLDDNFTRTGSIGEAALRERCRDRRPDLIVVTWLIPKPHLNMRASTFEYLHDQLQIPIALAIVDAARTWEIQIGELLYPYVDLIYCLDGTLFHREWVQTPDKYISTFMPLDTRRFLKGPQEPIHDVSFLGRVYNERITFLQHLLDNKIRVVVGGWTTEDTKVPLDLYADTLLQSKMTINTSRTGVGDTLKWRAIEATLAGTLLLEFADGTTSRYFEPYVDYIPFENENDLLDKVRYYLDFPAERERIAKSGHKKAWTNYTGTIWWKSLISELEHRGIKSTTKPPLS